MKYNRLTVVSDLGMVLRNSGRKVHLVEALCDCGNKITPCIGDLKNGRTKSCGCLGKEIRRSLSITHGLSKHPLHRVWSGIIGRCSERDLNNKALYFDRGINICDEWLGDFKLFYDWALLNGWRKGLHVDRRDNDKGYCPYNCRIVEPSVNANNRRVTVYLTLNGETKALGDWAKTTGIDIETLRRRISNYKWTHEKALTTPTRKYNDHRRI